MIDRRPLGHSPNTRNGRCTNCSRQRDVFALDGTEVQLCPGCIAGVVEEAGELEDFRSQLYEGATWAEWLDVHRSHRVAIVGCPMCGARSVSW